MRLIAMLLIGCLAIAVLQYALAALLIVLLVTVLWGAFSRPAETFGTLAFFLFANVLMNHTVATLAVIAFVGFWLMVRRRNAPDRESGTQGIINHPDLGKEPTQLGHEPPSS